MARFTTIGKVRLTSLGSLIAREVMELPMFAQCQLINIWPITSNLLRGDALLRIRAALGDTTSSY